MNQPAMHLCQYRHADDGTHAFTFEAGTREAVRAWAHELEQVQLAGNWYGKERVRVLLDARRAVDLPIRYLFECLSDYNREYPDLKPPRVRMAYLHDSETIILSIFYMFAELLAEEVTVEFFTDKAEALAWLQADPASEPAE